MPLNIMELKIELFLLFTLKSQEDVEDHAIKRSIIVSGNSLENKKIAEGNDSLIKEKLDPENLDGILHLLWEDDKLASCRNNEVDHYTDNPTAIRMCRLHTLKPYRRTTYGMPLTKVQID